MKILPLVLLLTALTPLPTLGINKCVGSGGKTIYTDGPCPENSKQSGKLNEMPPPNPEDVQRAREDANRLIERQAREESRREEERKARQKEAREEKERAESRELERRKVEALEAQAKAEPPATVIIQQPIVVPRRHHHAPPPPPAAQSRPVPEKSRKDGVRLLLRGD